MRTTATATTLLTLLALSTAQSTTSLSPDESLVSILSTEGGGISDLLSTLTDPLPTDLPNTSTILESSTTEDDSSSSIPTSDSAGTSILTNPIQSTPTGIVPGNGTTTTPTSGMAGSSGGGVVTRTSTPDASDVTATRTELSTSLAETSAVVGGGNQNEGGQQTGDTQSDNAAIATGVPVLLGALGLVAGLAL